MVKFHIATGHLGTLETNVLSTYVLKHCAGLDTAYVRKKINLNGDDGYQKVPAHVSGKCSLQTCWNLVK